MNKELVIHIITRLQAGGSAQNVIDSVIYQARERRTLLITGPYGGPEKLRLDLPENADYLELPELVRNISPLNDLKAFFRLKKIITELKPSIVHTHTSKAGILGRFAAWLANRKNRDAKALIVHTPHGHVFYGYFGPVRTFLFNQVERLAARVTDHFIALTCGELRESLAGGLGTPDKWLVIHSGVRFEPRAYENAKTDLGIAKEEIVIAVAARLEPVKGVEYFIRAAAELESRGLGKKLKFLVVGDGSLKTELMALAGGLGLGAKIVFTGFQREVYKYLAAADIYVQPSLNEAMGRTVLEAQYMKLPVVASKVCGLSDAVRDGVTAILVPPADPKAIAGAVEELIKDEQKRHRMREAGRRFVLEKDFTGYTRFSAESMNIQLKKFYNKVLAQHNRNLSVPGPLSIRHGGLRR
ncbi:MAG: glycosyltransferase [Elusimicrobia bacterium]|nr:glycosyltransferase [Elusimicrobiota bacterium]